MDNYPSAIEIAQMFTAQEGAVKGKWEDEELTPEELHQLDRDTISDDHMDRYDHLSDQENTDG
tara:strand:+ start:449 stop:637 length:189 start_codon:yes stop_codon:yes gene_type:complete